MRARALRALGELGRGDLRGLCMQALQDEEPAGRVQAAAAAVLRGDRGHALDVLQACVPNTSANAAPPPPSISAC